MVSGKPPRRSKSTAEPVTIDLKATEVPKPETERVPAGDAEAAAVSTPSTEQGASSSHAAPEEAVKTGVSDTSETGEAASTVKDEKLDKDDQATGAAQAKTQEEPSAADEVPSAAQADTPEDKANEDVRGKSAEASATKGRGPAMLAAGIAGGLVALIGMGGLQYAGVLPAFGPQSGQDRLAALSGEVEALKADLGNIKPTDTSALAARITRLEQAAPAGNGGDAGPAISDLQGKLAATNQSIDTLKAGLDGRLDSLTKGQGDLVNRVEALETKVNRPDGNIQIARAIAASALKTAADRGGPFLSELQTLATVVPDDPAIAALKPYAATGVASRSQLIRDFDPVANRILAAIDQPSESADIGERLWASAKSLIKVRPVGNVEGTSPAAIVARMGDKLQNGDLKGAAEEWNSLPQAGKAASQAFKTALDGRIAVETNVSAAVARAIAARQG
ncbi:mitofilin family membrane protein [Allorhizobium sp. BGMRC 0089]|uniref:mitofilin family membrane protein n=1 Tax=Allorhizobium sonneratiae TaxID=2934936 RepID=UPI0020341ABC|nr:mitofilin family membrane protein [Allorhizobium sonneratiae]MCM2293428.1 mitofilin family membrane protein [Allorhizobium sonneratiae]